MKMEEFIMRKPEILFLKQEDVIAAGVKNMDKILELTEKTFNMLSKGEINNPSKTMTLIPNCEDWTSYFMSMPVHIGGDINVAGIKWAAESMENLKTPGMPYGIDVVLLSDPTTVMPFAIMDGTLITAMRTSASAGVAAKYLAPKNSEVACLVGAGVIGRTMIMALMSSVPTLNEIRLVDLDLAKAQALADEFEGQIKIIPMDNLESGASDADIIATMTTARSPIVKDSWIKNNALVIQMSLYEIEDETALRAKKIVVDNWAQLKSKGTHSVFSKLVDENKLSEEKIIESKDVTSEKLQLRNSDDELIIFGSHGVGSLDIMCANYIYQNAIKNDIGTKLNLWDKPIWL